MKKWLLFFFAFIPVVSCFAQSKDEQEIRHVLEIQTDAWNRGDINGFMKGYWESDSLMFIGSRGITYGYEQTLGNYKRAYPDTSHMGKLKFDIVEVKRLSVIYFFVTGTWHLTRSVGDLGGSFTLLFKRIGNKWLIVKDHSS